MLLDVGAELETAVLTRELTAEPTREPITEPSRELTAELIAGPAVLPTVDDLVKVDPVWVVDVVFEEVVAAEAGDALTTLAELDVLEPASSTVMRGRAGIVGHSLAG